jgi:hypothetical protein
MLDTAGDVKTDETAVLLPSMAACTRKPILSRPRRLPMPESHTGFASDLRTSVMPVVVALLVAAVMLIMTPKN